MAAYTMTELLERGSHYRGELGDKSDEEPFRITLMTDAIYDVCEDVSIPYYAVIDEADVDDGRIELPDDISLANPWRLSIDGTMVEGNSDLVNDSDYSLGMSTTGTVQIYYYRLPDIPTADRAEEVPALRLVMAKFKYHLAYAYDPTADTRLDILDRQYEKEKRNYQKKLLIANLPDRSINEALSEAS